MDTICEHCGNEILCPPDGWGAGGDYGARFHADDCPLRDMDDIK